MAVGPTTGGVVRLRASSLLVLRPGWCPARPRGRYDTRDAAAGTVTGAVEEDGMAFVALRINQ